MNRHAITALAFALTGLAFITFFMFAFLFPGRLTQLSQLFAVSENIEITHPLMIEEMRKLSYSGSPLVIEYSLRSAKGYNQYIASYYSEGLKQYALLTVPRGEKPSNGWPVIIFNHGYIPPEEYQTTERYEAYVNYFAQRGYIVFKPDYRGHGKSAGEATGGYSSPAYTIDALNGLAAIKTHPEVDPSKIGMWGHSMGGQVTLRSMVVSSEIKAGVIWGGVVAPYSDLLYSWRHDPRYQIPKPAGAVSWREAYTEQYGTPESNPVFWSTVSPNSYVNEISGPVQLHHGTNDEAVPYEFSVSLKNNLDAAGKTVEMYRYENDNHDITQNFSLAMQRSVEFFDRYVKGE